MLQCDLVLSNARIVDVFRLRTYEGWVGIRGGVFVYVEEGDPPSSIVTVQRVELEGEYLTPGFIDSHMHIESSLLTPSRFAEAVLPHGTTTVLADPHEIANAGGTAGVEWFLQACRDLPLDVRIALPSCVPATSLELEWVKEPFDADTVKAFLSYPEVIALGEVMDYRHLMNRTELLGMIQQARRAGYLIEGHVPTLRGMALSEYISFGIGSDHTLSTPEKLLEQLSKGLTVMLQSKSLTPEVVRRIQSLKDRSRILLVTDDIEPSLLREGHLNTILRLAVELGMDPLEAVASATTRPARYLGLERGLRKKGAVAPGYEADFLILKELEFFAPRQVWVRGELVAQDGKYLGPTLPPFEAQSPPSIGDPFSFSPPFSIREPFNSQDFTLKDVPDERKVVHVLRLMDHRTSLTESRPISVEFSKGFPVWKENVASGSVVSVISRNGKYRSFALVENMGMSRGAFASSFSHDSHNLLVVGREPGLMASVANRVVEMGGGIALDDGEGRDLLLPLPVWGILSDAPMEEVAMGLQTIEHTLQRLGIQHQRPFLLLSLLSLSVSPYVKVTDRGLVDVEKRQLIPLFLEGNP
jgi:adenine deaminase